MDAFDRSGLLGITIPEIRGGPGLELKTSLRRDPEGRLRLNGRKYYCTGVETARWVAVTALDERDRHCLAFVRRGDPPPRSPRAAAAPDHR
jgi:alkylation response protein AidB-like acyl-CoA dehydrogenase